MSRSIVEDGLNVSYNETFYSIEKADLIFEELYKLNFKDCQLKIGSKNYVPLRKVCAFSDSGLSYKFSGTTIIGDEWTPLLLRLKEDVETQVGYSFNYVLVTLYENGHAKIGAHMDNEQDLDPETPIVALSFGAKRNLIFQRKGFQSVTLPLEHGSLYVMNPPTNQMWKHSIPYESDVKEPRISLTFRRIKSSENPAKKRKLQDLVNDELPENDWLEQCLEWDSSFYDITPPTSFELSEDVICRVNEFNGNLRVDIRKYKIINNRRIPTKEGVVMSPETWYHFCDKIYGFNFLYKNASFVVNNSLLALNLESLHLQQLVYSSNAPPQLKETFVKLNFNEVDKLLELEEDITKCLIEKMWTIILPRKILQEISCFSSPLSDREEIFNLYMKRLEFNMTLAMKSVFLCQGCIVDSLSQVNHDCIYKPPDERFKSLGPRAWLLLDVNETVKDLKKEVPSLNGMMVKGLTMDDYKRHMFAQESFYM